MTNIRFILYFKLKKNNFYKNFIKIIKKTLTTSKFLIKIYNNFKFVYNYMFLQYKCYVYK